MGDTHGQPSVVTLTLNPALDVSSSVDAVVPTHKLRCDPPTAEPGGGGINVARVCQRFGVSVGCVTTAGGPSGARLVELLASEGLNAHVVDIDADTRQSFAIFESSTGQEFRFVFPGPALTTSVVDRCVERVVELAAHASVVVVSGSIPGDGDLGLTRQLVDRLPQAKVVVDSAGPALRDALQSGCYLAKPSARELAVLAGRPLPTEADIAAAAVEIMAAANLEHLVVSLGPGGAFGVSADGSTLRVRAPAVEVKSTVGAGDAMVAGISIALSRGHAIGAAVASGVAYGTAAVITAGSQLCSAADVDRLAPLVVRGDR